VDTAIGYLQEVREDLLGAAVRGDGRRHGDQRGRPPLGFRDRFSLRSLVAAASVVILVVAGTVGWWVTRGGLGGFAADSAPVSGGGGATGATGAAYDPTVRGPAGVPATTDADIHFGAVPQPAPSDELNLLYEQATLAGGNKALAQELSRVIRTAEIGLVIPADAFDDRFASAVDIAAAQGGFVSTSTTRERAGSVTMRVPAANFAATLRSLRELGDVEVQSIQGRDVTADYVDLRARLRIAKSQREVLIRLMDRAITIEQTIRVQNALDDTQLRIEELQGQLRFLDDKTSLATIRLNLREEGVEPAKIQKASIPNAFERSIAGFVAVIAGVVVGLGYVIPLVGIGLLAWFVVSRLRRRRAA
jgi:uncharacterized protein DUF4349